MTLAEAASAEAVSQGQAKLAEALSGAEGRRVCEVRIEMT
jgi:hypothetical protein